MVAPISLNLINLNLLRPSGYRLEFAVTDFGGCPV